MKPKERGTFDKEASPEMAFIRGERQGAGQRETPAGGTAKPSYDAHQEAIDMAERLYELLNRLPLMGDDGPSSSTDAEDIMDALADFQGWRERQMGADVEAADFAMLERKCDAMSAFIAGQPIEVARPGYDDPLVWRPWVRNTPTSVPLFDGPCLFRRAGDRA